MILSTKRISDEDLERVKILPTINFLDSYSIKSWCELRKVAMDYGKQFTLRVQLFLSLAIMVFIGYTIYALSEYGKATEEYQTQVLQPMFLYWDVPMWYLPYLGGFLIMLVCAAFINSFFEEHKLVLIETLKIIENLILMSGDYLEGKATPGNFIY